MRNRAKCKLCKSIIESKSTYDCVYCACGEISIDGGLDYRHASVKSDIGNLICLDDEGNEIIPKYSNPTSAEPVILNEIKKWVDVPEEINTSSTRELLTMLDAMVHNIESLPPDARQSPVSHSDLAAALSLVAALFRSC